MSKSLSPRVLELVDRATRIPKFNYTPPIRRTHNIPAITGLPTDINHPRNFKEYIGQSKAKEVAKIIIDAANLENRAIPNILIYGPYGTGKTTLSQLVMARHNKPYRLIDGGVAAKIGNFRGYYIIDEIHNLPAETCDQFNTLMDSNLVHIVGCTTNPGALPAAFRSRLRSISLEDYTSSDIAQILRNTVKRKGMKYSSKSIIEIAKRSRYNPRHALQILAFALELTTLTKHATLTADTVEKALFKLDIDERGLTSIDRKYLSMLSSVKPTGLTQICAVLGTDSETIEYEIEPFLLREGYIERTARGRLLTEELSNDDLLRMLEDSIEVVKNRQQEEMLS